jgi:hypothetical protein
MPPTLGYYALEGPFAAPELIGVTKRLVFSAWHMVPRAVASLISYEAERRMMRAPNPRARVTQEQWKKQRGLLRFGFSAGRLTGLPLMWLVYPCLTFARDCDPRDFARESFLTAAEARTTLSGRVRGAVRSSPLSWDKIFSGAIHRQFCRLSRSLKQASFAAVGTQRSTILQEIQSTIFVPAADQRFL